MSTKMGLIGPSFVLGSLAVSYAYVRYYVSSFACLSSRGSLLIAFLLWSAINGFVMSLSYVFMKGAKAGIILFEDMPRDYGTIDARYGRTDPVVMGSQIVTLFCLVPLSLVVARAVINQERYRIMAEPLLAGGILTKMAILFGSAAADGFKDISSNGFSIAIYMFVHLIVFYFCLYMILETHEAAVCGYFASDGGRISSRSRYGRKYK